MEKEITKAVEKAEQEILRVINDSVVGKVNLF